MFSEEVQITVDVPESRRYRGRYSGKYILQRSVFRNRDTAFVDLRDFVVVVNNVGSSRCVFIAALILCLEEVRCYGGISANPFLI